MKVIATKTVPKANELIRLLKQEFASQYSYKLSGFGSKGTVIVSRWLLTAAQITIHENEIRIEKPSAVRAFISTVVRYATGFAMPFRPWKKKLQKQLATFLEQKYN